MTSLQALLFDVDGTLADTERDGHRRAFNRAFAEAGLDWEWSVELYGKLLSVTGGKERIAYFLDAFRPCLRRPEPFGEFVAGLHGAKTRIYTEMLAQGRIPLRPGVKRLIEEARAAGLRLAVATTTTPENVTALLRHALHPEAPAWFEVIAAGDVVPAKKPAPDIYLWAMERLGLGPEGCIAFEDSHNGLRASLGAGLKTIVSTSSYTEEEEFTGACLVVDHWGEPGQPFQVRQGETGGARFLDLALVRRLHGA